MEYSRNIPSILRCYVGRDITQFRLLSVILSQYSKVSLYLFKKPVLFVKLFCSEKVLFAPSLFQESCSLRNENTGL